MSIARFQGTVLSQEPLFAVDVPPPDFRCSYGFTRQADDSWMLNDLGRSAAAMAQRILLSYVLRLETRDNLSRHYCLSIKQVQDIVIGRAHGRFTGPLRERLLSLGIGNLRMHREVGPEREAQVRHALAKLAAQANLLIRHPGLYGRETEERVATDLYLLSGAWRVAGTEPTARIGRAS